MGIFTGHRKEKPYEGYGPPEGEYNPGGVERENQPS